MKVFDRNLSDRATTEVDHDWLERMVREIRRHLPRMLREHPDRNEFWHWFCGETDSLFRHVRHGEDRRYFQDFINKTLEDAGLEERFELTRHANASVCVETSHPHMRPRGAAVVQLHRFER